MFLPNNFPGFATHELSRSYPTTSNLTFRYHLVHVVRCVLAFKVLSRASASHLLRRAAATPLDPVVCSLGFAVVVPFAYNISFVAFIRACDGVLVAILHPVGATGCRLLGLPVLDSVLEKREMLAPSVWNFLESLPRS